MGSVKSMRIDLKYASPISAEDILSFPFPKLFYSIEDTLVSCSKRKLKKESTSAVS